MNNPQSSPNVSAHSPLSILRTGDARSRFNFQTPTEILEALGRPSQLLSSSAKAEKSAKVGVLNRVLFLTSGVYCSHATPGCLKACLGHTSGRMGQQKATDSRDRRSALYWCDIDEFMTTLRRDLKRLVGQAEKRDMVPAVRLNGTSDLAWEKTHREMFDEFPEVNFFDYTKIGKRMHEFLDGQTSTGPWPSNYHLTLSVSERNEQDARQVLHAGGGVAVVFWPKLPATWRGVDVINGEEHDARFRDPTPCVVGLSARGLAKKDLSGFVVKL